VPVKQPDHPARLLAVDLGLRTGMAFFSEDGRLLRYGSRHYGSRTMLRRGSEGILSAAQSLTHLIMEGPADIAQIWERAAQRRGLHVRVIDAERWRARLLLDRQRRATAPAKSFADDLARQVIAWSGLSAAKSIRHDASEAILTGLFGAMELGWVHDPPAFVPSK